MKGTIPEEMLGPVIDSLPVELTLIDADDKYIMWSELDSPIFPRPDKILGNDLMVCHPPKTHDRIRKLIDGMKSGKIDNQVTIKETEKDGQPAKLRVEYRAIRNAEGQYLGCIEICGYV